jgi:hypothetical protein
VEVMRVDRERFVQVKEVSGEAKVSRLSIIDVDVGRSYLASRWIDALPLTIDDS